MQVSSPLEVFTRFPCLVWMLVLLVLLFTYGTSGLRDIVIALTPPAVGDVVARRMAMPQQKQEPWKRSKGHTHLESCGTKD